MAVVACPKCDTMTEGNLVRGDVVECGQCQHKFVVTLKTLLDYDDIMARKAPPTSKIYRPTDKHIAQSISPKPQGMSKLFKVCMGIFGIIFVYGIVASIFSRDPNDHTTSAERQANYEKYVANKPTGEQEPVTANISTPSKTPEERRQQSAYNVADKYIAQREIAQKNGDKTRVCVLSGMIATAYLNANDEKMYRSWQYSEQQDCKH